MILVATHKPYWMPADPVYLPVQVGFGQSLGIERDNTGENIADRNAAYCELTALYWAWKNVPADFLGLVHYRRHFAEPGKRGPKKARVLTGGTLATLLARHEILLPKPRRYWIETNRSHYAHAHHEKDFVLLREVIAEGSPAYLTSFDHVMKRTWGHRFNMFVMKRPLLDAYAAWLFAVLFAVEARLDTAGYRPYDQRVLGFLAERLMDVWLEQEMQNYGEIPCMYMEPENWPRKAGDFLWRKAGLKRQASRRP